MTDSFVHLHFHTSYSLLDGYNPIEKAVKRLKELGMTSCAITDHGNLGGIPEWQDTCRDNGIKPILGVESYWTPDISEITKDVKIRKKESIERMMQEGLIQDKDDLKEIDKKGVQAYCIEKDISYESFPVITEDSKPSKQLTDAYMCDMHSYHLILLAMNQTGWKNLIKMQSIACTDGLYNGRGHVDNDLLRKYNEGIICQAACISSYFSRMVQQGRQGIAEQRDPGVLGHLRRPLLFGDPAAFDPGTVADESLLHEDGTEIRNPHRRDKRCPLDAQERL